MRGEDMRGAMSSRHLRQQAVPRGARRGRQSGFRFRAGPSQRAMRQIEGTRQALDVARLPRGLGAQSMIDRDGDEARTARQSAAPARCKPHQRDRIGAAGHGENDRRGGLPVREQALRLLCRDRGIVVGHGVRKSGFHLGSGPRSTLKRDRQKWQPVLRPFALQKKRDGQIAHARSIIR